MKADSLQVGACWKLEVPGVSYFMKLLEQPVVVERTGQKWVRVQVQAIVMPDGLEGYTYRIPAMPYRLDLERGDELEGINLITEDQFIFQWNFFGER